MKETLSGLVSKGYKPHKHEWQRTERHVDGGTMFFFVCTKCKPPVMKAYDFKK